MQAFSNFRQNTDLITSSGAVTEAGLYQLVELNYQLVINLLPDTSDKALANEKQIIESNNIGYCHIPVDFNDPKETEYKQFYEVLNNHRQIKTHIHCACNYRASAFYAVYAFENKQWSKQQAMSFIEDLWQPEEYAVWWAFLRNHQIA